MICRESRPTREEHGHCSGMDSGSLCQCWCHDNDLDIFRETNTLLTELHEEFVRQAAEGF